MTCQRCLNWIAKSMCIVTCHLHAIYEYITFTRVRNSMRNERSTVVSLVVVVERRGSCGPAGGGGGRVERFTQMPTIKRSRLMRNGNGRRRRWQGTRGLRERVRGQRPRVMRGRDDGACGFSSCCLVSHARKARSSRWFYLLAINTWYCNFINKHS